MIVETKINAYQNDFGIITDVFYEYPDGVAWEEIRSLGRICRCDIIWLVSYYGFGFRFIGVRSSDNNRELYHEYNNGDKKILEMYLC